MDILTRETSKKNSVDGHSYISDIKGKQCGWTFLHQKHQRELVWMDILTLETSKGNSVYGHSYTRDIKGKQCGWTFLHQRHQREIVWMDILTLETSKGNSVDGHSYIRDMKGNSVDGHSYTRDIKGKWCEWTFLHQSDLRQIGGSLLVLRFSPLIQLLTATIQLKYCGMWRLTL